MVHRIIIDRANCKKSLAIKGPRDRNKSGGHKRQVSRFSPGQPLETRPVENVDGSNVVVSDRKLFAVWMESDVKGLISTRRLDRLADGAKVGIDAVWRKFVEANHTVVGR